MKVCGWFKQKDQAYQKVHKFVLVSEECNKDKTFYIRNKSYNIATKTKLTLDTICNFGIFIASDAHTVEYILHTNISYWITTIILSGENHNFDCIVTATTQPNTIQVGVTMQLVCNPTSHPSPHRNF